MKQMEDSRMNSTNTRNQLSLQNGTMKNTIANSKANVSTKEHSENKTLRKQLQKSKSTDFMQQSFLSPEQESKDDHKNKNKAQV